jgi:hypothetical protein
MIDSTEDKLVNQSRCNRLGCDQFLLLFLYPLPATGLALLPPLFFFFFNLKLHVRIEAETTQSVFICSI